jgi:hypothetical protein
MTDANTQFMTHPNITKVSNASLPRPKRALLSEQTMSSLFANIVHIYRHYFRVIFLCSALPALPFLVILEFMDVAGSIGILLGLLTYMMGAFVVSGALTIALSDICVGNQPTVRCSYARIFGGNRWLHLISTGLVLTLATILGFLLLILPGLWLTMRGLFTSVIVALEDRSNRDAIRRSMALTKGQVWRINALLLPYYLLIMVFSIPLSIVEVMLRPAMAASLVAILGGFVVEAILTPPLALAFVLLYYDQRVRRESYDAQALSEDLMR